TLLALAEARTLAIAIEATRALAVVAEPATLATLATVALEAARALAVVTEPAALAALTAVALAVEATLGALLAVAFGLGAALARRRLRRQLVQLLGDEGGEHALAVRLREQLLEDLALEIGGLVLHAADQDLHRIRRLRHADRRQRHLEAADEDVVL